MYKNINYTIKNSYIIYGVTYYDLIHNNNNITKFIEHCSKCFSVMLLYLPSVKGTFSVQCFGFIITDFFSKFI